ncbi:type II secretion system protein [Candidatus Uhrbacteria bacterium]|nr:type II secretion system protein [Candidatus Uhrbacteria bacterium]
MLARGFTLLETLIVVSIMTIVFGIGFGVLVSAQKTARSQEASAGLIHVLAVAHERAMLGNEASSWGVYLDYNDISRNISEYVLFGGDSYATRNVALDKIYTVDSVALITDASLSGASPSSGDDHEVVFSLFSGETSQYGTVTLDSIGVVKTLEISKYGWAVWE